MSEPTPLSECRDAKAPAPVPVPPQLAAPREHMLALLRKHVRDERVIAAMAAVPRERFVPEQLWAGAYDDCALPIGEEQTISQPLMVALMCQAAAVVADDRVLEVGTGSGYQAAVLAHLARTVFTVERVPVLLARATSVLAGLGYGNVRPRPAAPTLGLPDEGPYDAIIVAAGAPHVPRQLVEQLKLHGRLVIPVGELRTQELVVATRTRHGIEVGRLGPCGFVPLIGEDAWPTGDRPGASSRVNLR